MPPLLRDGQAIGAIAVSRQEAGGFSDRQIALLQTFADQAVIAIENVRLFKELEARNRDLTESLDRQTATADILRAISEAQTDVQPVLEAIADSAMRLFGAWSVTVARHDGGLISVAAARGGLPGSSDAIIARLQALLPKDSTLIGRAVLTRAVQQIVDNIRETDPVWGPVLGEGAQMRGWRSTAQVPMLSGYDVLGVIGVSRAEPGGFSPIEIALLQTFADQAVIAVKNARLLTELQARNTDLTESLDRQTATAEILRVISEARTDVQPVFDAIADSALRLFGAWAAAVGRYDGELVSLEAARGGLPGSADTVRAQLQPPHRPTSPPEQTVLTKRVHHVGDVETDPTCGSEFRRHAAERGFRSFVSVPMLARHRSHGLHRREPRAGRNFLSDRARAAPDVRGSGGHRRRERAPAHGTGGAQPRPHRIARPPDSHRRDSPG